MSEEFRWQAFFQRSRDPLFLLNRQRRILFVNVAWEVLTGIEAGQARGLTCARRAPAGPSPWDSVTRALCPPASVLDGKPARVRRLVAGQAWDVDFLPWAEDHAARGSALLGVLGKITPVDVPATAAVPAPGERLLALREAAAGRYRLDSLDSPVLAVRRVAEQVRLAAPTRATVLIVGEEGTGKGWVARTIHQEGPNRERPFAAVDCGRLPPPVLASVLFGDDGLVTGGRAGTLYLKEPAALPRDLQARLVEALREPGPTAPRLVAGSCSDLAAESRSLRFLAELRCLLGTLVLELPPLRERQADLPTLVERLLDRAGERAEPEDEAATSGGARPRVELTPEAWAQVRAYPWPGNVAELYAVLAGARERAGGGHVDAAHLPSYVRVAVGMGQAPPPQERTFPLDELLEKVERRLIQLALRQARGNKTRAAEILSVWRPRLSRRLEALGLATAADEEKE
jgi:transcriptional regulator with PAS, ATPase and Fis domain